MYTQTESPSHLTDSSLTDVILTLCTSGHYGVREAIAGATRQNPRRLSANPYRRFDDRNIHTGDVAQAGS